MKKLLAVIIILCVGIMLVPMGLFADPPANAVAKVTHADGTVEYCTNENDFVNFMKGANNFAPLNPGDIVTLLKNITVKSPIFLGFKVQAVTLNGGNYDDAFHGVPVENITLDGGGYTIIAGGTKNDWNIAGAHDAVKLMGTNCTLRNVKINSNEVAWGIMPGNVQTTYDTPPSGGSSHAFTAGKVEGITIENVSVINPDPGAALSEGAHYIMQSYSCEVYASNLNFCAVAPARSEYSGVQFRGSAPVGRKFLTLRGSRIDIKPYNNIKKDGYQFGCKVADNWVDAKNYTLVDNKGGGSKDHANLENNGTASTVKREYIVYRDNLPGTIPCWRTEAEDLVKEGSHNTSVEKTIKNIGTGTNEVNFTREGWVFNGWNTKPDGTGSAYAAGDKVWGNSTKENSDIWTDDLILYAQWEKISIPIKFEANAAKAGGSMPETVYRGVQLNLPANGFICPGWTFDGWNTHPNGNGAKYADRAEINGITEPLTLYAQWKPADCTVNFDANGGTGTMQTQNFEFNKAAALSVCTFTCEGCIFAGWGTKADGSGDIYAPNGYYCFTDPENMQPVTLYALWLPAQP